MSFVYTWSPGHPVTPADRARFDAILSRESGTYETALGHPFRHRLVQLESLLIGQVACDTGVLEFSSWNDEGMVGIAWSGVCEEPLHQSGQKLARLIQDLQERPAMVTDWPGRFALCAWDRHEGTAVLITGATDSPSLWQVDGPTGVAFGSRCRPILELVGTRPEIDLEAASILLGYGYLIGDRALLGPARRVSSRTCVRFRPGAPPRPTQYVTIEEYLGQEDSRPRSELLTSTAARLRTRVRNQLDRSERPVLMLTGGRDSRSIAAALRSEGFRGPAITSGSTTSPDVRIASMVAGRLGLAHERTAGRMPDGALPTLETATLWMRLTEGLQSLRHGMSQIRFMQRELPVPEQKRQHFHGLGGEIARGYYYLGRNLDRRATGGDEISLLLGKVRPEVGSSAVESAVRAALSGFNGEVLTVGPSRALWLDLFYWQQRCLHWASDLLSLNDAINWHWTPFMSRWWVLAAATVRTDDKRSGRFVEELAVTLAADLRGVPYDTRAVLHRLVSRVSDTRVHAAARVVRPRLGRRPRAPATPTFWNSIFHDGRATIWRDLPGSRHVAHLIEHAPHSEYLWDLAGIELVSKAHLE